MAQLGQVNIARHGGIKEIQIGIVRLRNLECPLLIEILKAMTTGLSLKRLSQWSCTKQTTVISTCTKVASEKILMCNEKPLTNKLVLFMIYCCRYGGGRSGRYGEAGNHRILPGETTGVNECLRGSRNDPTRG